MGPKHLTAFVVCNSSSYTAQTLVWISSYFITFRENFFVAINIGSQVERCLDAYKDITHHLLTVQNKTQASTALNVQLSFQVTGQVL